MDKLIQSRKHKKREGGEEEEDGEGGEEEMGARGTGKRAKRSFHQAKVLGTNYDDVSDGEADDN